jgi:hypothetical protein
VKKKQERSQCRVCLLGIAKGWIGWYHDPIMPVTNHRAKPVQ